MTSMKEKIAISKRVNPEYRKALTPEQIAAPSCRWLHRWERVDSPEDGSLFASFQCRKCHDRKAVKMYRGGYSAPDSYWLEGAEWGYIPIPPKARAGLAKVPPPPTPESVQVTLYESSAPPEGTGK